MNNSNNKFIKEFNEGRWKRAAEIEFVWYLLPEEGIRHQFRRKEGKWLSRWDNGNGRIKSKKADKNGRVGGKQQIENRYIAPPIVLATSQWPQVRKL